VSVSVLEMGSICAFECFVLRLCFTSFCASFVRRTEKKSFGKLLQRAFEMGLHTSADGLTTTSFATCHRLAVSLLTSTIQA